MLSSHDARERRDHGARREGAEDHGARVAAHYGTRRSPRWHAVAAAHLARQPRCVACGVHRRRVAVAVHHIVPVHYAVRFGRPELELDERNLITLCSAGANHHLLVGHLGDYESADLDVVRHARRTFHGEGAEAIRASRLWKALVARRPPRLGAMTKAEMRELARGIRGAVG